MTIGTTRQDIIEMIRSECRVSSNTSRSVDNLPYYIQLVKRINASLTDEFAWPYMELAKTQAQKTMAAGQRYYDFPTKLSIEHITKVWYKQAAGNIWVPLVQGINPENYNEVDSDLDIRSDPVVAWDFITDENDNLQFEVWPMPASDGGIVWFEGKKKNSPMAEDNDKADHDDILITLRAAGEVLKAKSKGDSEQKIGLAADRFHRLTSRLSNATPVSLGKYKAVNHRRQRIIAVRTEDN